MKYRIKTNKGWIKRTSQFGQFHGNIVLTNDPSDALLFTREKDAKTRAAVARARTKEADDEGRWYSQRGRDYAKFGGTLVCTVEEVP